MDCSVTGLGLSWTPTSCGICEWWLRRPPSYPASWRCPCHLFADLDCIWTFNYHRSISNSNVLLFHQLQNHHLHHHVSTLPTRRAVWQSWPTSCAASPGPWDLPLDSSLQLSPLQWVWRQWANRILGVGRYWKLRRCFFSLTLCKWSSDALWNGLGDHPCDLAADRPGLGSRQGGWSLMIQPDKTS